MRALLAMCMVFVGCCSNVVFLELIVSEIPSAANIITFCQFFFISIEGFIFTTKFGTKASVIPLREYKIMTFIYLVTVALHNILLIYKVPIPIVVLLKSGSLVANLILGIIILKKRYKWSKYVSVALITVGLAVCTVSSAKQATDNPGHTGDAAHDYLMWLVGIGMLSFALFMSAWMGIFQEQTYTKFGKHPSEALFYNHALPMPFFLLLASNIYSHVHIFNQSAPMVMPVLGITAPKMWIYLLFNTLTQYVCIRSVFVLTTECTSLTVTLVVTLRKFVSLIFSIIYFRNPFTLYDWFGTSCVFVGTLLFTEVISLGGQKKTEKKQQ
ncbi:UDP-xylose and UDP-N-acetylglucosamine transporter-like isoform X2 [Haliotis rufescens]|uniref:UDP-xylose and UDP-N-acetylglucosamine transporter-like isoform X2 n=1 Tax=Haliotis rufescens TaxID=6454 RepID=UPI00201F4E7D|nr:UDP-xylose and UDP-N-acetylglucosamine transporter-like isoform X2 [Haliotis rufescens]